MSAYMHWNKKKKVQRQYFDMHAAVMQSTEDDCCGMQVKAGSTDHENIFPVPSGIGFISHLL